MYANVIKMFPDTIVRTDVKSHRAAIRRRKEYWKVFFSLASCIKSNKISFSLLLDGLVEISVDLSPVYVQRSPTPLIEDTVAR